MTAIVELWVDDANVGCGYRPFVICETGRKWVTLLQPAQLATLRLSLEEFRKARPVGLREGFSPRRTRAIIRRNVRAAKQYGWRYSQANVDAALAALAGELSP